MRAEWLPLLMSGPLLLAGLLVVVPRRTLERALLVLVPVISLAAGVALVLQHRTEPVIATSCGMS